MMQEDQEPVRMKDLRRLAARAGVELELRDGQAWVVVIGTADAARASAVASLVDELARQRSFHRVSVDLTCTILSDRGARAIFDALRAGAPPSVDMATPGAIGWLLRNGHAA